MALRVRSVTTLVFFPVLEDRLRKQQEDNDHERTRLQELITKMEMQLREQTRQLDAVSYNFRMGGTAWASG